MSIERIPERTALALEFALYFSGLAAALLALPGHAAAAGWAGATAGLADSINTLLVNWLLNHIKETDVKFGEFLAEKGVVLEGEVC